MKPTANQLARAATAAAHVGYTYDEMDCQAFIEHCARQAGGAMDYLGTNDMARRAAWLGTLSQAQAEGRLVPGAGLLIREETEANLPARYASGGLGDFSHAGLYVGPDAGSMAGIYDHRKVAFCTDHRNRTDIKGVSGGGFVGADAAFAQDDVGIAF